MSEAKVICTVAYNRPQYFRKVLNALSRCIGIEDYIIIPCVEPGNEEVRNLTETISFTECRPIFNPRRLWCNGNTHQAFSKGFELADFVILVEDDVLCSRDALLYFEHCRQRYQNDESILSVTGYNRSCDCAVGSQHEIRRRQWFVPWSSAFWKDRWRMIAPRWPRRCHGISWDVRINNQFCQSQGFREIYPLLSRAQNIGAEGGVYVPSAQWHAQHQYVPFWAEDADVQPGKFWENKA